MLCSGTAQGHRGTVDLLRLCFHNIFNEFFMERNERTVIITLLVYENGEHTHVMLSAFL